MRIPEFHKGSTKYAQRFDSEYNISDIARSVSNRLSARAARTTTLQNVNLDSLSFAQVRAGRILTHPLYQVLMGLCILCHMALTIYETDQNATGEERHVWQGFCETAFMSIYVLDILTRLYVQRRTFFHRNMNVFDLAIVGVDILCAVLDVLFPGSFDVGPISLLRALRTLRIVRVMRNFIAFRDLYLMVQGIAGSLRPICFAFLLIWVALTIFSIASVEMIHPINKKLAAAGVYEGCKRCHRAFSSVMSSNLTYFSSVIAGDGWGKLAIPIIEESPLLSFIILSAFTILELGLLNVIVAVVVDRQAQAREEDKELQHTLKEERVKASHKELIGLFSEMDSDNSGSLSLRELKVSYRTLEQFRILLQTIDVTEEDLGTIFASMDRDGGGSVDYEEFVMELHRMRSMEMRTLMYLTRQNVLETKAMLQKLIPSEADANRSDDVSQCSSNSVISGDDDNLNVRWTEILATSRPVSQSSQSVSRSSPLSVHQRASQQAAASNIGVSSRSKHSKSSIDTVVQDPCGWAPLKKSTNAEIGSRQSLPIGFSSRGMMSSPPATPSAPLAKEGNTSEDIAFVGDVVGDHSVTENGSLCLHDQPIHRRTEAVLVEDAGDDKVTKEVSENPHHKPIFHRNEDVLEGDVGDCNVAKDASKKLQHLTRCHQNRKLFCL